MKIKGFTPISDKILLELGLITAAVYGKIWRYCDAYGSCQASKQRLAKELCISERTVYNHLKILQDNGYIKSDGQEVGPSKITITNKISYQTVIEEVGTALDAGGTAGDAVKDTPIDIKKDEESNYKNAFDAFEKEIGSLTPTIVDGIKYLMEEWESNRKRLKNDDGNKNITGDRVVQEAIKIASKNNARRMKYVETIVKNWIMHYYGWTPKSSKNKESDQSNTRKENKTSQMNSVEFNN